MAQYKWFYLQLASSNNSDRIIGGSSINDSIAGIAIAIVLI